MHVQVVPSKCIAYLQRRDVVVENCSKGKKLLPIPGATQWILQCTK
jgi:hypothetical protein